MAAGTNGTNGAAHAVPLMPFIMVFGGCMSSIVFMEYLLKSDPNAGNFLNATEFVFVLLQSIPGRLESGSWVRFRSLRATWLSHIQHAVLWVSMSTLANYVFAYNISVPIHTLFRSCNVIASLILGYLFFGGRYTLRQLACVLVITVGIFLASIGDSRKFRPGGSCTDCGHAPSPAMSSEEIARWGSGIAMLVCVQMLQATLGHVQNSFYRRFEDRGSRNQLADEYLFTSHIVSLLMILVLWEDIKGSAWKAYHSPPMAPLPVPRSLVFMVLNNLTQLACIKGVFRLSAHCSPLTVNITLSVRKFLSVVISATWFGNPWTHLHSVATVAIFGGVFAYSQCVPPPPLPAPPPAPTNGEAAKKKD